MDGFEYDRGLDLTGYEDGSDNFVGDAAVEVIKVEDDEAMVEWK